VSESLGYRVRTPRVRGGFHQALQQDRSPQGLRTPRVRGGFHRVVRGTTEFAPRPQEVDRRVLAQPELRGQWGGRRILDRGAREPSMTPRTVRDSAGPAPGTLTDARRGQRVHLDRNFLCASPAARASHRLRRARRLTRHRLLGSVATRSPASLARGPSRRARPRHLLGVVAGGTAFDALGWSSGNCSKKSSERSGRTYFHSLPSQRHISISSTSCVSV